MSAPVGLHHTALTVADLDASLAWYQRVLGMDVALSEQSEHRRAAVLRFPGGRSIVGLVQHGPPKADTFDPTVIGLDHLALAVASREDLDAWGARLDEQGVAYSGPIDVPPGAILNFKDPDGIALACFWDRADD